MLQTLEILLEMFNGNAKRFDWKDEITNEIDRNETAGRFEEYSEHQQSVDVSIKRLRRQMEVVARDHDDPLVNETGVQNVDQQSNTRSKEPPNFF